MQVTTSDSRHVRNVRLDGTLSGAPQLRPRLQDGSGSPLASLQLVEHTEPWARQKRSLRTLLLGKRSGLPVCTTGIIRDFGRMVTVMDLCFGYISRTCDAK